MYLYITITFIIAWFVHLILAKRYSIRIANIVFLSILFPVLVFAMGFRDYHVGIDTVTYKQIFEDYLQYSWEKVLTDDSDTDRIELGFRILMKICGDIYPNYYFYQILSSLLFILLSFIFIYRYTKNIVLCCAIFLGCGLYFQTFNIARQLFAVIISAFAIPLLFEKKYLKSILIIFIAYLFHSTAIIVSVIYLIYVVRKIKFLMFIAPIVLCIVVSFINDALLETVFLIFGDKYTDYVMNDFSRPNTGIFLKSMWLINVILAIISYYAPSLKTYNLRMLALTTLAGAMCYWIGLSVNYVDRIGLYFLPGIILLYDKIEYRLENNWIKFLFKNFFTVYYITYFTYFSIINESLAFRCIIE